MSKQKFAVISRFRDVNTKEVHVVGSFYESDDVERVAFLQEKGYLEKSEKESNQDKFPKHAGGAWFELSNGEKVQGKDEAAAAQKELDKEGE
jgi:hypothetical protein